LRISGGGQSGGIDFISCKSFGRITKKHYSFEELIMCDPEEKCEKPENLETKPEECTPEQIKECHGDAEEHPCTEENKTE